MRYVESFPTKKWLTSLIGQEHQLSESEPNNNKNVNNKYILPQKQKQGNNLSVPAYGNHRHVVIGPSNVGKIY